jgi:hypothetical protein
VFVVVTLLVALGIAVVQACQGPARGFGVPSRQVVQSDEPPQADGAVPPGPRHG